MGCDERWTFDVQVLRDTVSKDDDAGVAALLRLCRDHTPEVRVAAPEALETVASRGRPDVELGLEVERYFYEHTVTYHTITMCTPTYVLA